ncbi:MAG: thiamine-monophosphate kinase [Firmicutes bacterium]|nr:thiamine-monophosphate kinase [Bacillota bacterium]
MTVAYWKCGDWMKVKQVGEFGLIDLIKKDTLVRSDNVIVGIGDDAAVLKPDIRKLQLLTTDMLVEDVHFELKTISAWRLGYKAMAVNFSDIAAMGGEPRHAVVSMAVNQDTDTEFIIGIYDGMKAICREYGVNIVGGDTVASPTGMVINVAVLGEAAPEHLLLRSGAKVGDLVLVTGTLGNSSGGLDLLSKADWQKQPFAAKLVNAHLEPKPQVQAALAIAACGASSMDDISDGLASEANEIAKASKVGMKIYAEKIPLLPELHQTAAITGKKALNYALYGGEDYELLFTISPERLKQLGNEAAGVSLTVIGEVVDAGCGVMLMDEYGLGLPLEPKGYNAFRREE